MGYVKTEKWFRFHLFTSPVAKISFSATNSNNLLRIYFVDKPIRAEHQSARMSKKLQSDGLTQSGTGCFIAVNIWQQWTSKG